MRRWKGSVTVFLVLILLCLFSGIFALLEAARVSVLKSNARMVTLQAEDGLLSSYNRPLWERYRLLFWQGQTEDFPELSGAGFLQQEVAAENSVRRNILTDNFDVSGVSLRCVEVEGYQLATDDGGSPFRIQAADVMKREVPADALTDILGMITAFGSGENEKEAAKREESAMKTLEDLKDAKKQKDDKTKGTNTSRSTPQENGAAEQSSSGSGEMMRENPIEWMKKVRTNGVFSYLMPEEDVSKKRITRSDTLGGRSLRKGTLSESVREGAFDRLLFRLYLNKYYQNVTEDPADGALDYEMEYLIAGKNSDRANLRAAVNRLLLMREGMNLLYLESSAEKQSIAAGAALTISAALGLPETAELMKQGILTAWAYAESVSDARILLGGGKVPLMKTDEYWHTQLDHISDSVLSAEGEKQQTGLSYENYLLLLLWTVPDKKLSCRAMDLIEKNLDVRMDEMVMQMDCSYEYEASVIFWKFVTLGEHAFSNWQIRDKGRLSYLSIP